MLRVCPKVLTVQFLTMSLLIVQCWQSAVQVVVNSGPKMKL